MNWTSLFSIIGVSGVCCFFLQFLFLLKLKFLLAHSVDPDQTPRSGSIRFANVPKRDARLILVKYTRHPVNVK